jgi:uncharacterized DUF497 family protein
MSGIRRRRGVNYAKYGVHFADAVGALEDDRALTEPDETTFRGDDIRLISAREAKPRQKASYERKRR